MLVGLSGRGGKGGKLAENATFLNTWETLCEPQFPSGVTVHASTELRGPTLKVIYFGHKQAQNSKFVINHNTWSNVINVDTDADDGSTLGTQVRLMRS